MQSSNDKDGTVCPTVHKSFCNVNGAAQFFYDPDEGSCLSATVQRAHVCNRSPNQFASIEDCLAACVKGRWAPEHRCVQKPRFVACTAEDARAQVAAPLPPTLDYVHEATGRVDFRSFESVTQALRVVHSAKEAIPVESLTIIVPLLLSLVLAGWWWYKGRQSSSTTSADSRTSCRSNSSLHTLQESDEAKHRRPGGPTLRSYRLGRRRHSVPIPSVQFPALANFGPAESTGRDLALADALSRIRCDSDEPPESELEDVANHATAVLSTPVSDTTAKRMAKETSEDDELRTAPLEAGQAPCELLMGRSEVALPTHSSLVRVAQFENTLQLRSVVQQLALTIAVAEEDLEFEHRALTARHVLVKAARGRVARFRIMNNSVYIELHGFKVTVVDFAASRLCAGAVSVSSDTDQPLNVGGRLKRWLRDAVWPDLLGYNPTICGGVLEDFSAAEYHGGTLRTEELAPRPQTSSYGGCTRDDVNRADDANRASTEAFETPLLDDIYCRRSDASEDGTDETEVVEGNWADLDESRPQRLEWQPSHHHQRDERRRSGLADWELSHVNNSGLSEDTAYLALPENKCPSEEVLGACSFDQHQQNAWCAAAAAVAPCFVSPVEPLRAPRHSQDVFDQLLKACRQPEAVAFSEILQELEIALPVQSSLIRVAQFENTLQLRSVVQQLALTIAVAEEDLEFEHRALTARHVLVKAARGRVARFRIMNNSVYIELHGFKVTVVDFAASRLCAGA
ncbi:hypothetical protein V5799_018074, partial [Amblyomma americanum]